MSSGGRISKAELDKKKSDIQTKKKKSIETKAATKKRLESLQKEGQTNPENQNALNAINQRISDIEKDDKALEAEEKRLDDMTPMDLDDNASQPPNPEGENASSTAQVPDPANQAEENLTRNNGLNQGSKSQTENGNAVDLSPPPDDDEDQELPVMTPAVYKQEIGDSTTPGEVLACKASETRGTVVIIRYGPKSHPAFRIERPVEGFDPNQVDDITKEGYRIGEQKQGKKWLYDYRNVDGIVAVAFAPKDIKSPLYTIDPARHFKGSRYPETQVLIQWRNIIGKLGKPRTWETRTTARRICPMRGAKGIADKMIFERARQCEDRYAAWLLDHSKGRDATMTPAPLPMIKVEEGPEVGEVSASIETPAVGETRSKSVTFIEPPSSQQKLPGTGSGSATSQAPGPVVTAAKGANTGLDRVKWCKDYCDLIGRDYETRADWPSDQVSKMVDAYRIAEAKAEAAPAVAVA